jgi:hypothetical protein
MSRFPVVGPDVKVWANDLRRYLARQADKLTWFVPGQVSAENGMILWNEGAGYAIISAGSVWQRVAVLVDAPASATALGAQGELATDANYIYVCTATNTWKRVAISTW